MTYKLLKFLAMKLFQKKPESIKEFSNDEFEKVKFKARIALIDDEEIPHVKRLQRDGYNIVDYPDISEIDDFIRKKYHVVILDIQGVGSTLSEKSEGWGLLKYLKSESPHTIVIMFTGADWSITKYKPLADSADDFLGKDLEFLDFKSKLDAAIRKAFSIRHHFEIEKRKMISEISNAQNISKIEEILFKYGRDRDYAMKEVRKVTSNQSVINSVDSFLSISSSILELILL